MARLVLVAVLLLGAFGVPGWAEAATFTVGSTDDIVDAVPGDGLCATSTGTCTLRAAVQETNALGGTNTVLLPAGTYTLTIPGANEDLAATGDLDITNDLTITGADRSSTIVDGNGLDRVFEVAGPENLTSISHLTVRNGAASPGAAIASYSENELILSDCTITENKGDDAIFLGFSLFTISDSEVSRNSGTGMNLGYSGFYTGTLNAVTVTANAIGIEGGGYTLTNGLIADNGIGVFARSTGSIVPDCGFSTPITQTRVLRNGTGIVLTDECFLSCTDCVIADNGDGISSSGGVGLENSSVIGNTGAGISAYGHGAGLSGVTLSGNHGGGMFISTFVLHEDGSTDAEPVIIDRTTISGNSADGGGGGGGGVLQDRGAVVISNSTIVDNTGGSGITIRDASFPATIENTIVAGNSDASGGAPDCAGALVSNGHNLIQSLAGCSLTGDLVSSIFGRDPLLGPLTDNGGPTFTHALLAGSPAIDAGPVACGDVDQRGLPRPQLAACDIGAFEFACGNGLVDPGEQCDPGSGGGGCCSTDCQFLPSAAPCPDDGDPCTSDRCDGAGTCTHPIPMDAGCQPGVSGKATMIRLVHGRTPRTNALAWTWASTDVVTPADLGDPLQHSDYTLCVIADAAASPTLVLRATAPAGGTCAGTPCWASSPKSDKYRDKELTPDGLRTLTLKPGLAGRGKLAATGTGPSLAVPLLGLTPPVIVRLQRDDATTCWDATYAAPARNDTRHFRARASAPTSPPPLKVRDLTPRVGRL